jgi:two-component system, OmpR family, sensor histidine kinase PhoQ
MALVRSLRARVVLWVSVALIVLFAITIAGLDVAFRNTNERALFELLEVQVLGLIALVEQSPDGELTLPGDKTDSQFQVANSGLYGALFDGSGRALWQSLSLLGRDFPVDELPAPGQNHYVKLDVPGFPPLEALLWGITWEFSDEPYTIAIAVSLEPYDARQQAFRRNLIGWFGGVTLTMMIVIGGLLTFLFLPLRRLERQVREVEAGERVSLTGRYPTELVGLAANLNALIETERRRLERYRHTLDDLAHSLKTPLAAMRALLGELKPRADDAARAGRAAGPQDDVRAFMALDDARALIAQDALIAPDEARAPVPLVDARAQTALVDALNHELERMDQRVSYQLRRARASGSTGFGTEPVAVAIVVEDLKLTLDKVYRDKRVVCTLELAPGAVFRGDPGDLTEILGNVMDNAYKYCKSRVHVVARSTAERLELRIGDDGGGISAELASTLGERGKRADESVPGQGIGLAVVRQIVELYRGTLTAGRSALGGAEIRIELARAGAL